MFALLKKIRILLKSKDKGLFLFWNTVAVVISWSTVFIFIFFISF